MTRVDLVRLAARADEVDVMALPSEQVVALVQAVQAARGIALLRGPESIQPSDLAYLRAALAVFGDESPEAQEPSSAQSDEKPSDVRGGEQR